MLYLVCVFSFLFSVQKKTFSNDLKSELIREMTHIQAKDFAGKNEMSLDFYILVDFSVHSGKKRMFLYDFQKDSITASGLCTHGTCDQLENNATGKIKYSNQVNSHCSSLGKYKIGKRDYSSWGINVKYWLHGLEKTNNNAEKRVVVLHSWSAVANVEIFPNHAPLSWGCPAVSDEFMRLLDSKLNNTKKPILLWIIDHSAS